MTSKTIISIGAFLLLTGCISGLTINIPEETGEIHTFFCDRTDCVQVLRNVTNGANDVVCAMYHLDKNVETLLKERGAKLVVDEEYPMEGAVVETGEGLMHNKFCVFGDVVWTGSWNPAQGMTIPNNVVVVKSKTLATAYRDEFEEMYHGTFHGGSRGEGLVLLNGSLIEAYFCPEDACTKHVLDALNAAKKSIHFMAYSFTDDAIGALLEEKNRSGLDVRGIFDPHIDQYSEYDRLKDISRVTPAHHKVFLIDGETVITGSYNPTKSANERNDENVIIIHKKEVAGEFEKEFERLWDKNESKTQLT